MTIQNKDQIDVVSEDHGDGPFRLIMIEDREWSLSSDRTAEIEGKITAYYNFVASGQFVQRNPKAAGRKCIVELFCNHMPPPALLSLFPQVAALFARRAIDFRVVFARRVDGALKEEQVFPLPV